MTRVLTRYTQRRDSRELGGEGHMKAEAEIRGMPGVATAGEAGSSPLEPLRKGEVTGVLWCLATSTRHVQLPPQGQEHTCTCAEAEGVGGWKPTAFHSSQAGSTVVPGARG